MFTLMLDFSKAFDSIDWQILCDVMMAQVSRVDSDWMDAIMSSS
jgi:hypothetical protein